VRVCPRPSRSGWCYPPAGGADADGTAHAPNPALKILGLLLFVSVAAVIVVALLWITRATIIHHFGVDLFPFIHTK
jgi:hypothetical protein